jgi:copper(I)-binding protein
MRHPLKMGFLLKAFVVLKKYYIQVSTAVCTVAAVQHPPPGAESSAVYCTWYNKNRAKRKVIIGCAFRRF